MGLTVAVGLEASISITSGDFTYSQNFDSLPAVSAGAALSWTNNTTIAGWYQAYTNTVNANTEWSYGIQPDGMGLVSGGGFVTTNSSSRFSNLGHANSNDRSVGMTRTFSVTGSVGMVFQNNSEETLPGFIVGYTGEQWRRYGTIETPLYFEYQIVSNVDALNINSAPGSWIRVGALQFNSPRFDGGGLDLDGKHPDNRTVIAPVEIVAPILDGEFLVVRWHQARTNSAGAAVTTSHQKLAIDDVSVAMLVVPDPNLALDLLNTDEPDFNFGNVFSNKSRKVTYVNNSAGGLGTINIDSIAITDNADGLFTLGAVTWSDTGNQPLLSAGDSVTIEVIANNSQAGTFTGQLTIDTTSAGGNSGADENDLVLPLNSTTFPDQALLNANPLMSGGLSGWSGNAAFVTPGIAPGSPGMARVRGAGDPAGSLQGSLYQSDVPNGFSNFQLVAYFTPINAADFADYVDPAGSLGITGPAGNFADRTFQWVLLGSDVTPPNPAFGDTQAANTLINLAYLPDGNSNGGAPGFYVFDGTAGAWVATGIGAIAGSTDHDTDGNRNNGIGDGRLDTTVEPNDVINTYRLVVKGTGLGTSAASYDIAVSKVSGPDSFTSGSANGLTAFHGLDGKANTATGHAFITSDVASDSNGQGGFRSPFWVDDAAIYNGTAPDPNLTVLSTPSLMVVIPPATTGSTSFTIRNDGTATGINVTSIDTGTSGFTVTSPTSFSLSPGAAQQIDVQWDSAASAFTSTYEAATLTIQSSNFAPVTVNLEAGVRLDYPTALSNGSFETPGADNVNDTDTFADWDETVNPASITDVPGLIAPSIKAAALAPLSSGTAALLAQDVTSPDLINFTLNFDFSVPKVARDLILFLETTDSLARVNIGYNSAVNSFVAFNGTNNSGGGAFVNVLPISLTAGSPYKLRVIGTNWGSANRSYTIDLFDSNGSPLGTSGPLSLFQNTEPPGTLSRVAFSNQFGSSGGFTVDEVFLSGQGIDRSPPVPLQLSNPVFVPGSPNQLLADVIGGTVDIYRSTTLEPGSWGSPIITDLAPGIGLVIDGNAPLPRAFYIGVKAGGDAP